MYKSCQAKNKSKPKLDRLENKNIHKLIFILMIYQINFHCFILFRCLYLVLAQKYYLINDKLFHAYESGCFT